MINNYIYACAICWEYTWTVAKVVRAFLTPSDTTCTTGCIFYNHVYRINNHIHSINNQLYEI